MKNIYSDHAEKPEEPTARMSINQEERIKLIKDVKNACAHN